jgi:hypothetical protein
MQGREVATAGNAAAAQRSIVDIEQFASCRCGCRMTSATLSQ